MASVLPELPSTRPDVASLRSSAESGQSRIAAAAIVAAAIVAAGGCGGSAPPAGGPDADPGAFPNCLEAHDKSAAGSSFVIAVDQPVDPAHAPVPVNAAEAIVFRLLYGTLTEVDCTGSVRPALAEEWIASPDGLVWTFRLRRDVSLARADRDDRVLLDAALVRDAWRESRRRLRDAGDLPWPWERVLLRDVRLLDSDRLEVRTSAPEPDLPALLSRPEFAVAFRDPGDGPLAWPRGTRGVISDPLAGAAERDLVWWPESKDRDASVARITFRIRPGADARDLADADLLFVRDRAALAYFESRADLRPVAALWSARLFLLTRHPAVAEAITPEVRDDLAARAVTALATEATGAPEPAIAPGSAPAPAPPDSVTFLHDEDDAAAADVARRLAATSALRPAVARGLPAAAFAAALRSGAGEAFVARIPVAPSEGLEPVQLTGIAPWILGGQAVPLLDPRAAIVAREGLTGIVAGRDGVPRLERAGWVRGRTP